MRIVITEEQYRQILNEGIGEKISLKLEKYKKNFNKIISDLKNSYNFHVRFGLTYGAGIGAILPSIIDYLNKKNPNLSDSQIEMIAVSAVMIIFFEGKQISQIKEKIESDNLESELSDAVNFTDSLYSKFRKLLVILGVSLYRAGDVVSYAFLLPLLTELYKLINLDVGSIDFELISKSILIATGIMISGNSIKKMVEKLK